jgi:7-cyano-7-deazaguanine synthase in queuosine biosynthesis
MISAKQIQMTQNSYEYDLTRSSSLGGLHQLLSVGLNSLLAKGFYLDDRRMSGYFGRWLDPLLADWLDIALAVYGADRLSARRDQSQPNNHLQWSRVFHLRIPVKHPEIWRRSEVNWSLSDALRYFTDDEWHFDFVECPEKDKSIEKQRYLFNSLPPVPFRVALYSGGLDSFAGATQQIAEMPNHSFVFVSGTTNPRQDRQQRTQVSAIKREFDRDIFHVRVPFGIRWRNRPLHLEETQRTRGFMFLTLGAVTALTIGATELFIYENGIGAINLPYDGTQIGTASSRGVHPLSLLRMSKFIKALTGKSVQFINPFLFRTKGEMCRHKEVKRLAAYISDTFSCDGFPVHTKGKPQCGSCTSCLLRRLSLQSAGLSDFDSFKGYLIDLLNPSVGASTRQLQGLKAMEWQYHRIDRLLKTEAPWRNLEIDFPQLRSIVSEISGSANIDAGDLQRQILHLYSQYTAEWGDFSARQRLLISKGRSLNIESLLSTVKQR